MTRPRSMQRIAGWLMAGAAALALVAGAAAFALAAERRESVLVLDLGTSPPSAPAVAVLSEAAPAVVGLDPSLPAPTDPSDAAPVMPDASPSPMFATAAPMTLPQIDPAVAADLSLPTRGADADAGPEPTVRPKARPSAKPETKPKPEPDTRKKPKETGPAETAHPETATSSASAPSAAARPKGGDLSPADYARSVLKKVRATKRKPGAGKGSVVVGFTIAADGGLASVQVLQSSGNAELDAVALDHIRRSAPFPPPVKGAKPGFSFEFIGR